METVDIKNLIEEGRTEELRSELNDMLLSDIIELIHDLPDEEKIKVFDLLELPLALKTFKLVEPTDQKELIRNLPMKKQHDY